MESSASPNDSSSSPDTGSSSRSKSQPQPRSTSNSVSNSAANSPLNTVFNTHSTIPLGYQLKSASSAHDIPVATRTPSTPMNPSSAATSPRVRKAPPPKKKQLATSVHPSLGSNSHSRSQSSLARSRSDTTINSPGKIPSSPISISGHSSHTQPLYGNSLECTLIPTTSLVPTFEKQSSSSGGLKSLVEGLVNTVTDIFSPTPRMSISSPYNAIHLTHVGYNPATGEFTGLPREWQNLLEQSGISRHEQQAHPQAVLDIIGFYSENMGGGPDGTPSNGKTRKGPTPPSTSPTSSSPETSPKDRRKPSAPSRPAHTLSIYSTELPKKPGSTASAPSHGVPALSNTMSQPSNGTLQNLIPSLSSSSSSSSAAKKPKPPKPLHPRRDNEKAPRPRPKKEGASIEDLVVSLANLCNPQDPTKLYKNLVKIGQGASGGVFTATIVKDQGNGPTTQSQQIAIKQMVLEQQPKKELIVGEIVVMKGNPSFIIPQDHTQLTTPPQLNRLEPS